MRHCRTTTVFVIVLPFLKFSCAIVALSTTIELILVKFYTIPVKSYQRQLIVLHNCSKFDNKTVNFRKYNMVIIISYRKTVL